MARAALLVFAAFLLACSVYEGSAATGGTTNGAPASAGSTTGGNGTGQAGASGAAMTGAGGDVGTTGAGGGGGDSDGAAGSDVAAPPASGDAAQDRDDASGMPPVDGANDDGSGRLTCAGYALQFGGFQAYVRVNRPVQDDFTLEAWVKTQTPGINAGANFWQGSGLLYADAAGDSDDFGTALLGTKFVFGVGHPNTTITSAADVTTGTWVHVAATRRMLSGEIQIVVNGKLENAKIAPGQVNSLVAQPNMSIGGNALDGRFFTGLIDEVRAWNVVRTPDEIKATMNKRLVGNEPGLVAYWRFDEGTGAIAGDSSQIVVDGAPAKNNGDFFGTINWVPSDAPICP